MSELKPCPFCGGEAAVGSGLSNDEEYYFVNCADCLAATNHLICECAPKTKKEAAGKWNQRHDR